MSTVVFFHAHPDDEVLLTGGTMAKLAAQGHRVVLVVATSGEAGLSAMPAADRASLREVRKRETREAAELLGCARVVFLDYPDSGSGSRPIAGSFATTSPDEVGRRLSHLLAVESAAVLTGYDPVGGYGHRDHVQVHRAARAAAAMTAGVSLLEATVDRRALQRALRVTRLLTLRSADFAPSRFDALYTAHDRITHCIDVRSFAEAKRLAMQAHISQAEGGDTPRTLERLLRLPVPVFDVVFGREWYVHVGAPSPAAMSNEFPLDVRDAQDGGATQVAPA